MTLRAVGHRCQVCNGGVGTLDVHHRTYERLGQELDEGLTVLCRACHSIFHEQRRGEGAWAKGPIFGRDMRPRARRRSHTQAYAQKHTPRESRPPTPIHLSAERNRPMKRWEVQIKIDTGQINEVVCRQYALLRGTTAGMHVLIAAARYLAAHCPTMRS